MKLLAFVGVVLIVVRALKCVTKRADIQAQKTIKDKIVLTLKTFVW